MEFSCFFFPQLGFTQPWGALYCGGLTWKTTQVSYSSFDSNEDDRDVPRMTIFLPCHEDLGNL